MAPPARPLPDLCLIALFKQLPPTDQLSAALLSPRCRRLVRAANRRGRGLKTLVIISNPSSNPTSSSMIAQAQAEVNAFNLGSRACLQALPPITQDSDDDFLFLHPATPSSLISKWNCLELKPLLLQQQNSSKLPQLITQLFPTLTGLAFLAHTAAQLELLIELLQLNSQLTRLTIVLYHLSLAGKEEEKDSGQTSKALASRLVDAINRLGDGSAEVGCADRQSSGNLQTLALTWYSDLVTELPPLAILSSLQAVAVRLATPQLEDSFLRSSLIRFGNSNRQGRPPLEVHLAGGSSSSSSLVELRNSSLGGLICVKSKYYQCHRHFRLVRYADRPLTYRGHLHHDHTLLVAVITRLYRRQLRTVDVHVRGYQALMHLEGDLCRLQAHRQLLHLKLYVNVARGEVDAADYSYYLIRQAQQQQQQQLPSVRALELALVIRRHDQVQQRPGLNLARLLPQLQVLHLLHFDCLACGGGGGEDGRRIACLRAVLPTLHVGVSPARFLLEASVWSGGADASTSAAAGGTLQTLETMLAATQDPQ